MKAARKYIETADQNGIPTEESNPGRKRDKKGPEKKFLTNMQKSETGKRREIESLGSGRLRRPEEAEHTRDRGASRQKKNRDYRGKKEIRKQAGGRKLGGIRVRRTEYLFHKKEAGIGKEDLRTGDNLTPTKYPYGAQKIFEGRLEVKKKSQRWGKSGTHLKS